MHIDGREDYTIDRCGLDRTSTRLLGVREKRGLAKQATPGLISLGYLGNRNQSVSTELCICFVESRNLSSGLVVDLDELDLAGEYRQLVSTVRLR